MLSRAPHYPAINVILIKALPRTYFAQPSRVYSFGKKRNLKHAYKNCVPSSAVQSLREIASTACTLPKQNRLVALFEWSWISL